MPVGPFPYPCELALFGNLSMRPARNARIRGRVNRRERIWSFNRYRNACTVDPPPSHPNPTSHSDTHVTWKSRARTLGAVTRAVTRRGPARGDFLVRLFLLAVRQPVRFFEQPAPGTSIIHEVRDRRLADFDAGHRAGCRRLPIITVTTACKFQ